MTTTQAVVFTGVGEVEFRDIPMPAPSAGEVQIRTEYSMISAGTEGWALLDQFTWAKTLYPSVPGYQRVGVIEALGEGVTNYQIGERVMATTGCWQGEVPPFWGSHVALGNSPAHDLYRLPDGANPVDASGAIVAQVGYNAASRVHLRGDDWIVVYGDGIIGQSAAQAARARGANVILVGHRRERLELGAQHSADHVINSHEENVVEKVRTYTGQETVTAILDSVQVEKVQHEYLPLLQGSVGQIVYCGFTPGNTWADMAVLQQRELTTHFVSGWTSPRMGATLELMAQKKMKLSPLVTHQVKPEQAPAMYRIIGEKSEPFMGIVFDWSNT